MNIKKYFFLILYRLFFRYLPKSGTLIFGPIAKKLRYICCKQIFAKCGTNVNIERLAFFGKGFELEIGDNSGLGVNCSVPSNIKIGNDVMMGPEVYILPDIMHCFDKVDVPMWRQGYTRSQSKTMIGNDVWIGRQVIFTPGHTIGNGCIIGCGSVITKDFDDYSVVAGNPAKLIKKRL